MKYYSYLCSRFGSESPNTERSYALVAELVDAPDLGSGVSRRAGSSPVRRTERKKRQKMLNNIPQICDFDRKMRFLIKKIKIFLHN